METQEKNEQITGFTEEQLEEIRAQARDKALKAHHEIKQRGVYLVCTSCEYPHTFKYIGPHKRLIGFKDDGTPMLKDLK